MARVIGAYLDLLIGKDLFEQRKNALLMEHIGLEEKLRDCNTGKVHISDDLAHFLETLWSRLFWIYKGKSGRKTQIGG